MLEDFARHTRFRLASLSNEFSFRLAIVGFREMKVTNHYDSTVEWYWRFLVFRKFFKFWNNFKISEFKWINCHHDIFHAWFEYFNDICKLHYNFHLKISSMVERLIDLLWSTRRIFHSVMGYTEIKGTLFLQKLKI